MGVRRLRGGWGIDFRDQFKKRHREIPAGPFATSAEQKRAAHALLAKREEECHRGTFDPNARKLTFEELADRYLESKINIRATTRRSYGSVIELYLKPYFGFRRVQQISAADIERYRNTLVKGRPAPIVEAFADRARRDRPGLSKARAKQKAAQAVPGVRTINKSLTMLVMIFGYACRHRWLDFNPAEHVEKVKATNDGDAQLLDDCVLSPSEIHQLFDAADTPLFAADGGLKRNNTRLLLEMAVHTGMRSGELRGLQWGDVDWASQFLQVRRAWREGVFHEPKTQASRRRIDLSDQLIAKLREWKLICPRGQHDLVFPNLAGNPISHANLLQRMFYPTLRRAGLRKIRFHDLRHTFASLLISSGADVVRVSRMLGHASPAVTLQVYSHVLPDEHRSGSDMIAKALKGSGSRACGGPSY